MPNPWTKKNPAMSLFLSGANAWAGKARGIWTKEARRQHAAAMTAGAKRVASFWTSALMPPVSGGKTRKSRRQTLAAGTRYGVEIRAALPADAGDIALLLRQLGHEVPPREAAERLDALRHDPNTAVLVAVGYGPVIGLVALRWCAVLQQARPVARITTLVVDEAERRRGIGRLLVKAAAQTARIAGCDVLDLTIAPDREETQAFWRAIGFAPSALGFSRALRKKPPGA